MRVPYPSRRTVSAIEIWAQRSGRHSFVSAIGTDMRVDMRVDTRVDMHVDTRVDTRVDMRVDMRIDMRVHLRWTCAWTGRYIHVRIGMRTRIVHGYACTQVYTHVQRHALPVLMRSSNWIGAEASRM